MDLLPSYVTGFFAVLLLTSFVKIFTVLNILRFGIGLKGGGFGLVLAGCALALSLLVMGPQIERAGGLRAVLADNTDDSRLIEAFQPFLSKNAHPEVVKKFSDLSAKLHGNPEATAASTPVQVLVPAFLISELKEAFQAGFMLLVPFLIVDLIVVNILMVLGITQMSQATVSLPLKILLFFALDGWTLLSEKLIAGYL